MKPSGRAKVDASPVLLIVIVALAGAGVFFTMLALRSDPMEEALSRDRVINTLFVLEDQGKPLASYVLMYYPGTKRAAVYDIPGELGLILRRINRVDRIDTIYDTQKLSVFEGEIENLLGIDINFTVVFESQTLGKLVDLIEGVELFIHAPVSDFDSEPPVFFPSGLTRLDGDKARVYLAYRQKDESDESISFRRQRFFLALIKRMGEKNEFLKTTVVAQIAQPLLKTTMSQRTRFRLFDELAGIDTDRVSIQSIGGNTREVSSGQTLLFPFYDGSLIKDYVRESLGTLTRQVEGVSTERVFTVEVLNGTSTVGLAMRTAELLRGFGYDVISVDNADTSDHEVTEIIDRSGYEEVVKTFADIIRCKRIRSETASSENMTLDIEMNPQNLEYRSDFTLIIGKDFNGRYVIGG
ncbi:MAG: LCP family protein [Treponema sp.]|jgi:anionic cell wall polymer biosynthesis LytR-Cps2A-Psr (LCP) family protein|nr:LCP family protein [Treponema sp.]